MPTTLADLTTMRLGGSARAFPVAESADQLVELVRTADVQNTPVLVLGGGSNVIVGDQGFDGVVVRVANLGLDVDANGLFTMGAGTDWDTAVQFAQEAGLAGLEALSGIPGCAGGTPIQNVGAYGTLTSDHLSHLTVYDRHTDVVEQWPAQRCGFGPHRQSVFKRENRYIVLDITFQLTPSTTSGPVRYLGLADRLGIDVGASADTGAVRAAVLQLRQERGMLLDAEDHDTWSVGSFFLNPVVSEVPPSAVSAPQYADPSGVKLSAAWLIEQAGFPRGYGRDWGRGTVALSSKHTLAITNRGGATTADVMAFAGHVRTGVRERFGIELRPECDLINCRID